jgi:tRNA pseudouridine13 synthase
VLSHQRHLRKLKRGVHAANHFRIRLTQLQGDTGSLVEKLRVISEQGVPNYFGEQRFGHGGGNVDKAKQWFAGELKPRRPQRSLYLSAVRSHIFNELLAERVTQRHWNKLLTGELLMLEGTHSVFPDSDISNKNSTDLSERLAQGDIHLTGPMAGKVGKLQSSFDVAALEHVVMLANADLCKALEQQGLKAERRALRVIPQNLQWQLLEGEQQGELVVEFSLPSGCFATAIVRECVRYQLADKVNEGDG